jgi:hypothetical protein
MALRDFVETTEPTQLEFDDEAFGRLRQLLLRGRAGRRRQATGSRRAQRQIAAV